MYLLYLNIMSNRIIRTLNKKDYNNGYLQLLEQDFNIESKKLSFNDFTNFVDKLNINHQVFVIYNDSKDYKKVYGSATVFIENKIIHQFGKVAHIEDVIIDNENRGKGFGKLLIQECIEYAKLQNCYKVILNCSSKNIPFYEKNGFIKKEYEMALYF